MKIVHKDLKKGTIKVKAENLDDLWYLSHIVDRDDLISGRTERKVQLGRETEKSKQVKKLIFVKIKAEKLELGKDSLRINGIIEEGPDDIPHGTHQSIDVQQDTVISIEKKEWLGFQLEKLKQAQIEKAAILMCIHDREEAYFALLKRNNYKILSSFRGDVQKKGDDSRKQGNFYLQIIEQLKEYKKRHNPSGIIVASPAFFKEDLMKEIKDDFKKEITIATVADVSEKGFDELLKREETRNVLRQDIVAKETEMVEKLFENISREGLAVYGIDETEKAVNLGAVETLLVSDMLVYKSREKGSYERLDRMMKQAEKMKGNVHLISSEHDAGKRLDGIGGIAGLLRYKLSY